MNIKQKVVVWIGLAILAQISIYPPWTQTFYDLETPSVALAPTSAYYWIFSPPGPPAWVWDRAYESLKYVHSWGSRIDIVRLLVEWGVVILVFGGVAWTLGQTEATK